MNLKLAQLSNQQLECLYYLVTGKTIKKIAETMNLSARTVEHYLETVKSKLCCKTREELIKKAFQISYIKEKLQLTYINKNE